MACDMSALALRVPAADNLWTMHRIAIDRNLCHSILRLLVAAIFAAASIFALSAVAQTYPSKPVRIIVPNRQGGGTGSRRGGWCWGGDGARPPGLWHCILRRLVTAMFAAASILALPCDAQTYPSK